MMAEEEKTQPSRQKKLQTSKYDDHETSIVVIDKPDERRLAFLERAIAEAGRGEIQKHLGIGNTTIYYCLTHDDIFISYIFRIAEIIGKKVKATIGPM